MRLAVLVVLCGCWRGSDAPVAEPVPPSNPTTVSLRPDGIGCGRVASNVHEILKGASDDAIVARADRLRDVILTRCNADDWSIELRQCLATASTLEVADDCENLASPAQQEALEHEVEQIEAGN